MARTWVLPIQGRADFCNSCPRASLRFALGYHLRPPWGKNDNKTRRRPPSIGPAHIYFQLSLFNFLEPPARATRDSPSNNYSMCPSQTRDRGTYHFPRNSSRVKVRLRLTAKRNTVQRSITTVFSKGLSSLFLPRCSGLHLPHRDIFRFITRGLIRLRRAGCRSQLISQITASYHSSRL